MRIWREEAGEAVEHRGEVREVATGAYRGFSRWEDLTSFLADQLDIPQPASKEH